MPVSADLPAILCQIIYLPFVDCDLFEVSYIWLLSLTSLALWLGWVSIALILDHHYHRCFVTHVQ